MLAVLVRDSGNYKIKTHAAAALASPRTRAAYGGVFADSLLVLLGALEALQQGGCGSAGSVDAAGAAGGSTGSAAAAGAKAGAAGAAGGRRVAADGDAEDECDFPNFRWAVWRLAMHAPFEAPRCCLHAVARCRGSLPWLAAVACCRGSLLYVAAPHKPRP